jgi:hypothetical protein
LTDAGAPIRPWAVKAAQIVAFWVRDGEIMAVRSLGSADRDIPGAHRPYGPSADLRPPIEHSLRPRLAVMAPRLAEAVRFAGGWLFDQAMAGWDVAVLTADDADARPLRILGARAADLETVLNRRIRGSCLQAIAVRADLCGDDARVRRMVSEALAGGLADVRLWSERWPDGPDRPDGPDGPVWHRLSVAARAFKAQALAAAAVPAEGSEDTEVFRSAARYPALVPAP